MSLKFGRRLAALRRQGESSVGRRRDGRTGRLADLHLQYPRCSRSIGYNEASIEGNEGTGTKTSNRVEVEVPPNRASRSKSSRRSKAKPHDGTAENPNRPDHEYKIIVKNTGNVPFQFGELTDADCEGISPCGGHRTGGRKHGIPVPPQTDGGGRLHQRSVARRHAAGRRRLAGHAYVQQGRRRSRPYPLHDRKAPGNRGAAKGSRPNLTAQIGQTVEYQIDCQEHRQRPVEIRGPR